MFFSGIFLRNLVRPWFPPLRDTQLLLRWALGSSLLIAAVLALRFFLKNKLSARLRYALWAVVLLRLLIPLQVPIPMPWSLSDLAPETPESWEERTVPMFASLPYAYEDDRAYGQNMTPDYLGPTWESDFYTGPSDDSETLTRYAGLFTPNEVLQSVWWVGALFFLGALILSNARFALELKKRRRALELPDVRLPVYVAGGLPSSCLFGVFRPAVYLTPPVAEDEAARRHTLAHELTHYAHGDHLWSLLRCLCLALHWYNPLAWLAAILSKRDGELACDEGAVNRLGEGERLAYGLTLVNLVAERSLRPGDLLTCSTAMTGGRRTIQERVATLVKRPRTVKIALAAAVIAVLAAGVCAFAGGSSYAWLDSDEAVLDYAMEHFTVNGSPIVGGEYVESTMLSTRYGHKAYRVTTEDGGDYLVYVNGVYYPHGSRFRATGIETVRTYTPGSGHTVTAQNLLKDSDEPDKLAELLSRLGGLTPKDIESFAGGPYGSGGIEKASLARLIRDMAEHPLNQPPGDSFVQNDLWALDVSLSGGAVLHLSVGTQENAVKVLRAPSLYESAELYQLIRALWTPGDDAVIQADLEPVRDTVDQLLAGELAQNNLNFQNSGLEAPYTGVRLTNFRRLGRFPEVVDGAVVNLYYIDFGLEIDDLSKAGFAGGNYADGNGLFHPYGHRMSLAVVERDGQAERYKLFGWEYLLEEGQVWDGNVIGREDILSILNSLLTEPARAPDLAGLLAGTVSLHYYAGALSSYFGPEITDSDLVAETKAVLSSGGLLSGGEPGPLSGSVTLFGQDGGAIASYAVTNAEMCAALDSLTRRQDRRNQDTQTLASPIYTLASEQLLERMLADDTEEAHIARGYYEILGRADAPSEWTDWVLEQLEELGFAPYYNADENIWFLGLPGAADTGRIGVRGEYLNPQYLITRSSSPTFSFSCDAQDFEGAAYAYADVLCHLYLNLDARHPMAVTLARVGNIEIYDRTADAFAASITLIVDPVEPNSIFWMAGSGLERVDRESDPPPWNGDWLYTHQYRIERQGDGLWRCTEVATGGLWVGVRADPQ